MHGFFALCLDTVLFGDVKSIGGVQLSVNETIKYDKEGGEKSPCRDYAPTGAMCLSKNN